MHSSPTNSHNSSLPFHNNIEVPISLTSQIPIPVPILAMLQGEIGGIHYLAPPENHIPIPTNYGMMENMQTLQFSRFLSNFPNYDMLHPEHEQFTQSSSISNNSTSDDAEDQHQLIDERKQRRMISNRESARRSRMRKQKHLDELWSQVVRLRTENHSLMDKLNHATECHEQVLQENARLKEETCDLRQMLMDLQIGSPFRDLEEIPCNTTYLRSESSDQSTDTSVDLLR